MEPLGNSAQNGDKIFLSLLASHLLKPFLKKHDLKSAHEVLVWQHGKFPENHAESMRILQQAERIIDVATDSRNVDCLAQAREILNWQYSQFPNDSRERTDFSQSSYLMEASDKICAAGLNLQKPEGFNEAFLALKWQYDQIPADIEEKDIPLRKVPRLIEHINISARPERFGAVPVLSKETLAVVRQIIHWQQACRETPKQGKIIDLKQNTHQKVKIIYQEPLSAEERINQFLTNFNKQRPQPISTNKPNGP